MMPVVAATITSAEFRAVEHEHFVKPKGFVELGVEAHWVLDGLAPEGREVMLHVVPAVPRFVRRNRLEHLLGERTGSG